MIATNACFSCLQSQVDNLCAMLQMDSKTIQQNIDSVLENAKGRGLMPPQIAIDVYESFRHSTHLSDPFAEIKKESIAQATKIVQSLLSTYPAPILEIGKDVDSKQNLESQQKANCIVKSACESFTLESPTESTTNFSADSIFKRLNWAVRVAILGNVIDYGSQHSFDFAQGDFSFHTINFARFDLELFISRLNSAQTLLYIADNAGENLFDEVLLQSLKSIYPHLQIFYATRGEPIINDLTITDLAHPLAQNIQKYCTLLDSGVRSPGFVYAGANAQTRGIYDNADVILAKGMGNFECLNTQKDERLFLLFKVKCDVVAQYCDVEKGRMMFIHNRTTKE
ncbi:damage-control phosphatase ARMT1 family protein [Helicobacter typhlonius]|uniref:damage-control phosphatase ARMT1 family protein n=1 Tax=Helicobacter typhlonius TaxID=76936 RepID=UPI002FE24D24